MKNVTLHPDAEADIEQSGDFYESRRTGYGERFRSEVDKALRQIGATPKAFALYKNGPTRRRLLKGFPYAVYFLEKDDTVHVLAVYNQRGKPDAWADRLNDV
jgi:toxin ParE1/3/4